MVCCVGGIVSGMSLMCVCVYVCMYVCTYVCMCVYTYMQERRGGGLVCWWDRFRVGSVSVIPHTPLTMRTVYSRYSAAIAALTRLILHA